MKVCLFAAILAGAATSAAAVDTPPAMIAFAKEQVREWVNVPEVIAAVKAQNAVNEGLSEADIIELDTAWRAQVGASDAPMIAEVLGNALSAYLSKNAKAAGGAITEVFVMDMHGLNVGQSAVTSDYWQGDEAKYQETYLIGPDAMHVSEVELDESTQTYQGQVSMPLLDSDGSVVGAVTVGLNAQMFF